MIVRLVGRHGKSSELDDRLMANLRLFRKVRLFAHEKIPTKHGEPQLISCQRPRPGDLVRVGRRHTQPGGLISPTHVSENPKFQVLPWLHHTSIALRDREATVLKAAEA